VKEGIMIYDFQQKRYDVRFSDMTVYGGLHCGECFDVRINNEWKPTRIEYDHKEEDWYLQGLKIEHSLLGLSVRMS
jgi:hypothetical protein